MSNVVFHGGTQVILLAQRDHVLLGQRYYEPYKDHWSLPGGHINNGEQPYDTAVRETLEETGIDISELNLFMQGPAWVHYCSNGKNYINFPFMFSWEEEFPTPTTGDGEFLNMAWFKLGKFPERMFPPSMESIKSYQRHRCGTGSWDWKTTDLSPSPDLHAVRDTLARDREDDLRDGDATGSVLG